MRPAVLIGANGQLGSDLAREMSALQRPVVPWTRSDVDIRDHKRVEQLLQDVQPELIVNTAAFHKVEACETDPEQAFAVNCLAVRNLALNAERIGARLVHFSTDYVFDGRAQMAYPEDAASNPINAYGASKAAGEFFVRNLCSRHLLIRTSGLYGVAGSSGKGGNFVQTMLRLGRERGAVAVVNDQTLSPTFTADLAGTVVRLIDSGVNGVFHVTNAGWCSWFEFAQAIFALAGMTVKIDPVVTASTNPTVRRPTYSVLANHELGRLGFSSLRPWREALARYLEIIGAAATGSGAASLGVGHATS